MVMPLRIKKKIFFRNSDIVSGSQIKACCNAKQAPNSIMHLLTTSIMNGRGNVQYSNESLASSP